MEPDADVEGRFGPGAVGGTGAGSAALGVIAAVAGVLFASLYPATVFTQPGVGPQDLPHAVPGSVVLLGAVFGPLLVTWGAFAARHRTLAPLTVRRSLLAPLLSVLTSAAGVAAFTYEWVRATPFEVPSDTASGDVRTVDPALAEIVRLELGSVQVVALVAVAATVVGTVTARRGWRAGIASAVAPAALAALALTEWWTYYDSAVQAIPIFVVLAAIPLAVGYVAASSAETTE